MAKSKHKYSTIVLLIFCAIAFITIVGALFTSEDIDEVCSDADKILKRNATDWECADDDVGSSGNASFNQTLTDTLYAPIGAGNASWNESRADILYQPLEDQRVSTTNNVSFDMVRGIWGNFSNFLTETMSWSVSDDGSNIDFNFPDVGGNNYVGLSTTDGFMQLYANPNPSNDYLLWTVTETQGADTEINIYEGGTTHNRFWSSGSVRIGGDPSYLCSNMTTDVDCDTPLTGADLVVQDDIWSGGKIFANDWSNLTDYTDSLYVANGTEGWNVDFTQIVTETLNITNNISISTNGRICGNADCTAYQEYNGTAWIIQS